MPCKGLVYSALSACILCGCIAPDQRLDGPLPDINRVGVVSVVGEDIQKATFGITRFGDEIRVERIADWGLDRMYTSVMVNALKSAMPSSTEFVPLNRESYLGANALKGPYNAQAYWGPNWSAIRETSAASCRADSLDIVVIAAQWETFEPFTHSDRGLKGVGFFKRRDKVSVYALMKVAVIGCPTGELLAEAPVLIGNEEGQGWNGRIPMRGVDPGYFEEPVTEHSTDSRNTMTDLLQEISAPAYKDTLQFLLHVGGQSAQ